MPHDLPQDWNVVASSMPVALVALVLFIPVLGCFFRGLEPKGCQPNVVGILVAGVMLFVCCPLLFFSLVSFMSGFSAGWVEFQMYQDGRLTDTGVVGEKLTRTTVDGESGAATVHHCLRIDFRDYQGNLQQVEREIDQHSWNQHPSGSRVPDIQYLQSAPTTWRFAAESGLWLRLLGRGGVLAALGIALRFVGGVALRLTRGRT